MRDIDHDDVDSRGDERGGALVRIAGHADRGRDEHARILRELHLADLLGDREVAVDHAEPAETAQGDGHARLRDGVHRGGKDGDAQRDALRELRLRGDFAGDDVATRWDEEDVVERETFLGEALPHAAHVGGVYLFQR